MTIDLKTFTLKVQTNGVEACLPCHMSDDFLFSILEIYEEVQSQKEGVTLSVPIYAISNILMYRNRVDEIGLKIEELEDAIEKYKFELLLEAYCRVNNLTFERASIKNILTNRKVDLNMNSI
jgi:hypothetical protein